MPEQKYPVDILVGMMENGSLAKRIFSNGMLELHVVFQGSVQGVGFRAKARKKAQELGLTGTVGNLSDGSVELIAQGKEEHLKALLHYLHREFDITESNQGFVPITQAYQGFEITSP